MAYKIGLEDDTIGAARFVLATYVSRHINKL